MRRQAPAMVSLTAATVFYRRAAFAHTQRRITGIIDNDWLRNGRRRSWLREPYWRRTRLNKRPLGPLAWNSRYGAVRHA
jgi:hypothetical protein